MIYRNGAIEVIYSWWIDQSANGVMSRPVGLTDLPVRLTVDWRYDWSQNDVWSNCTLSFTYLSDTNPLKVYVLIEKLVFNKTNRFWRENNWNYFPHSTSIKRLTCYLSCYWSIYLGQPWWCHRMETFLALLAICAGNSPVSGEFPAQWPVTRSFDIFVDLRLNKRWTKQSWGWWFETLSCPLWR